jgi:hypothetical protein
MHWFIGHCNDSIIVLDLDTVCKVRAEIGGEFACVQLTRAEALPDLASYLGIVSLEDWRLEKPFGVFPWRR